VIALVLVGVLVLAAGGFAGYRLLTGTRGSASPNGTTQLTVTPVVTGNEPISGTTITAAMVIIRQRLDSSGVSGAELTNRGGSHIVVVLPGNPDQATRDLVLKRGVMRFRPVLVEGSPSSPTVTAAPGATATEPAGTPGTPADGSDPAWVTPDVEKAFTALDCANTQGVDAIVDNATQPMVTCSVDGTVKYILGPAEVLGSDIKSATASQSQGGGSNDWEVRLSFNGAGTKAFCAVTSRLMTLPPPRSQFGIVLDKRVLSAPSTQAALCSGDASLTGGFTEASAKGLAIQLNFRALPLTLKVESEQFSIW